MPYKCRKAYLFTQQKSAAKARGIEFRFTLAEWIAWWEENLGKNWMALRGCRDGQYVMARNGDHGPYAPWNVKCITAAENSGERAISEKIKRGEKHPHVKLTEEQVREARAIYVPYSTTTGTRALARRYGVCHQTMSEALRGINWRGFAPGGASSPA